MSSSPAPSDRDAHVAAQNRMPVHPQSIEECAELLRWRADMGRRSGFEGSFASLSPYTQATLFGIAGELEHIADFLEGLDRG